MATAGSRGHSRSPSPCPWLTSRIGARSCGLSAGASARQRRRARTLGPGLPGLRRRPVRPASARRRGLRGRGAVRPPGPCGVAARARGRRRPLTEDRIAERLRTLRRIQPRGTWPAPVSSVWPALRPRPRCISTAPPASGVTRPVSCRPRTSSSPPSPASTITISMSTSAWPLPGIVGLRTANSKVLSFAGERAGPGPARPAVRRGEQPPLRRHVSATPAPCHADRVGIPGRCDHGPALEHVRRAQRTGPAMAHGANRRVAPDGCRMRFARPLPRTRLRRCGPACRGVW